MARAPGGSYTPTRNLATTHRPDERGQTRVKGARAALKLFLPGAGACTTLDGGTLGGAITRPRRRAYRQPTLRRRTQTSAAKPSAIMAAVPGSGTGAKTRLSTATQSLDEPGATATLVMWGAA